MTITVEAMYEDGMLKPLQPLPFKEHEKVQVTVEPARELAAQSDDAERAVRRSYGLLGWTGTWIRCGAARPLRNLIRTKVERR